jgi:hypothetical protein
MVTMSGRDQDDVYPAALLRIALALKKDPDASLAEIVERTAVALSLPRKKLSRYLAENMAMLTTRDFRRGRRQNPAIGTVQAVARIGGSKVKSRSPR